ncbi:MAG: helix-turn-helix transcriptional regulator [Bdellovibrionales bacterium]|nr:helix-turn-helix transcriptional regulator [Bdellovibrionales bacterium]
MDYNRTQLHFLNSIVEEPESKLISRRLNYSYDKIKRWLRGETTPRWNEFCDLCLELNYPIAEVLTQVFAFEVYDFEDTYLIPKKILLKPSVLSQEKIAQQLGVSLATLKRYMHGSSLPTLELSLAVMDLIPGGGGAFMLSLLNSKGPRDKKLESLQLENSMLVEPWAAAVQSVFNYQEYKNLKSHCDAWVANFLGLPLSVVEKTIEELAKAQWIFKKDEKWEMSPECVTANLGTVEAQVQFVTYWTKRALERFLTDSGRPVNQSGCKNVIGVRIGAISEKGASEIIEVLRQAEEKVHQIYNKDQGPKTELRAMISHFFAVNDHPLACKVQNPKNSHGVATEESEIQPPRQEL